MCQRTATAQLAEIRNRVERGWKQILERGCSLDDARALRDELAGHRKRRSALESELNSLIEKMEF